MGAELAKAFFLGRGALVNYGTPGIDDTYLQGGSVWLAFLAEAIGAFVLMWAVMGTAVNPNAPKGVAGVAIGGALGARRADLRPRHRRLVRTPRAGSGRR